MNADQGIDVLAATQLFGRLDRAQLRHVWDRVVVRTYRKGDVMFHQGDPGESLYVVARGLVNVYVGSEAGDEMVLASLRPPEMLGELAVIDGGPRSASARAIEPTTVLALTRTRFMELVRGNPAIADALHESLGALLRRVLQHASDLVFLDLAGRVAKLLVTLADERGETADDGIVLDLHLSQTHLAGMVGGSRPSVNQILRAFQERGYLEMRGRTIVVKRPDALRRRAGA
ncbi:MAG TPA: Crp/Fnr family transcriptional regulator [Actinomycetota bacterium]|nr:Crp/Fnr family transcriptional regulator [Actinomycetota bacterium]